MKVNLFISSNIQDPHTDIHTTKLSDNIEKAISILEKEEFNDILTVNNGKDIVLLSFNEVFMFKAENKQVTVFTNNNEYVIKKPLYQVESNLNQDFVRISKTTIINLKKVKRVSPSLKGMMFIELKNGLKDNISRKYLPEFKKALDL